MDQVTVQAVAAQIEHKHRHRVEHVEMVLRCTRGTVGGDDGGDGDSDGAGDDGAGAPMHKSCCGWSMVPVLVVLVKSDQCASGCASGC